LCWATSAKNAGTRLCFAFLSFLSQSSCTDYTGAAAKRFLLRLRRLNTAVFQRWLDLFRCACVSCRPMMTACLPGFPCVVGHPTPDLVCSRRVKLHPLAKRGSFRRAFLALGFSACFESCAAHCLVLLFVGGNWFCLTSVERKVSLLGPSTVPTKLISFLSVCCEKKSAVHTCFLL
jgi:hypothetical protein